MARNKKELLMAKKLWGWEPHIGQREWMLSKARVKVAACGRRWGKTEAAAVDAALMAVFMPGSKQMIVAPTSDQSRLIFDTVDSLITGSPVLRPFAKVTRTPYPKLIFSKSIITARTADEDGRNLRGNSADRVIVDEAAYVRDSVIYEVISPMLADRDGKLIMVSTPFGKNHFYKAFALGKNKNSAGYESFRFPSSSNPHISSRYIEEQRSYLSKRQFAVEYEAEFIDDQSSVFTWQEIEAAMQNNLPDEEYDFITAGIDWARYSDYTAVIVLGVKNNKLTCIAIDRFNGIGWNAQIERAANFLKANNVSYVLTDQTSVGDPLLEQLKERLIEIRADTAVEGFTFTNQSKRGIIDNLALLFSHRQINILSDDRLISELQYFDYELTQSGNVRMNARSGHHDDLVTALALAAKAAKEGATNGGFMAIGTREAGGVW